MGKIAEAYVEVTAKTQAFDKGLDQSQAKLGQWINSAQKLVAAFVIARAGQELVGFLAGAAKAASDLAESANKAGVAFGSAFPKIEAFADDMATRFGVVKSEIFDITAGLGFMITNAGFAKAEAAQLAIALAKSAADVSSIQNMPIGVILEKMRSGISGEAEPLRTLGVNVSEENVKKQASAMGITNKVLTDQEKIYARIALILKGLSYAQGDLEKTIGGYANATRRLAGEWENLKAKVGGPVAGFGADTLAAARQAASNPSQFFNAFFNKDDAAKAAFQRDVDKAAGVNSDEMQRPAPDLRTLREKQLQKEFEQKQAFEREFFIDQPGRKLMANIAQGSEPIKQALGQALSGNVGSILGGFLRGGIAGGIAGAAQGGLLNPIAQRVANRGVGPLSSHLIGGSDFQGFAQERAFGAQTQIEAAKEAAKNTKETVTELKQVVGAIQDLGRKFVGNAILRGPS